LIETRLLKEQNMSNTVSLLNTGPWVLSVDRGAGSCLIVKVARSQISKLHPKSSRPLADEKLLSALIWEILEQHLNFRLVVELEPDAQFSAKEKSDLLDLGQRVRSRGGMMRLVGQPDFRLDRSHQDESDSLPCYADRNAAIMTGSRTRTKKAALA
jgi:hypothetical protein